MSFLSDVLDFEKFNLKDIGRKIKDDPERLLLGGITPWDTKITNKLFGNEYEPLVDQMGGAYGGHTLSAFGNQDGGVYARARDAGIDPKAGGQVQDLAHIIAAAFAGGYGGSKIPGLGGSSGGGSSNAKTLGNALQNYGKMNSPQQSQSQMQPVPLVLQREPLGLGTDLQKERRAQLLAKALMDMNRLA